MEAETAKCGICNQEKVILPEKTRKKNLPVFVCVKAKGKAKTPCDGPVFAQATKKL